MPNLINKKSNLIAFFFFLCTLFFSISAQEKKLIIKGTIYDEFNETVPFVTVGILNKAIGTASNEDGEFVLKLNKNQLKDTLYVSSLGFDTFKMKVEEYLAKKERKITLKENIVSLEAVQLLHPIDYVKNALKKLKVNTLSKPHLKYILFRRAATEEGKAKFLVENLIKFRDRGPAYWIGRFQVYESRKSADYRFWKRTQSEHALKHMVVVNPLRPNDSQHSRNIKKFTWKKTGSSSYEGEDVVIVEGKNPEKKWERIIMYIGIDDYKIYRIERSGSLYIYKKHQNGKMYLSYYKNEWKMDKKYIPQHLQGTIAESLAYKYEAYILNVETDKKKIKINDYGKGIDMGKIDLPYHPEFWKELNTPPDTKFFKRIKSELESLYGVPLEKQYNLVNKPK